MKPDITTKINDERVAHCKLTVTKSYLWITLTVTICGLDIIYDELYCI